MKETEKRHLENLQRKAKKIQRWLKRNKEKNWQERESGYEQYHG